MLTSLRYINNINGSTSKIVPYDFRGGVIGDTMGLGKSLTAIALVASDKDRVTVTSAETYDHTNRATTLLVVKASCTYAPSLQS